MLTLESIVSLLLLSELCKVLMKHVSSITIAKMPYT